MVKGPPSARTLRASQSICGQTTHRFSTKWTQGQICSKYQVGAHSFKQNRKKKSEKKIRKKKNARQTKYGGGGPPTPNAVLRRTGVVRIHHGVGAWATQRHAQMYRRCENASRRWVRSAPPPKKKTKSVLNGAVSTFGSGGTSLTGNLMVSQPNPVERASRFNGRPHPRGSLPNPRATRANYSQCN